MAVAAVRTPLDPLLDPQYAGLTAEVQAHPQLKVCACQASGMTAATATAHKAHPQMRHAGAPAMQRQCHQLRPAAVVRPHHPGGSARCPAAPPATSSARGCDQLPVRGVCGGPGAQCSTRRSSRPQAETPARPAAGPPRRPAADAAAAVRRQLGSSHRRQRGAGWPRGVCGVSGVSRLGLYCCCHAIQSAMCRLRMYAALSCCTTPTSRSLITITL